MIAMGRKNEAEQVQESLIDNLLIHVQKRQIQEIDWSHGFTVYTVVESLPVFRVNQHPRAIRNKFYVHSILSAIPLICNDEFLLKQQYHH